MLLSQLVRGTDLARALRRDVEISSLTCDTRTLTPGGLFAAFSGAREDGNDYILEALARGAAAVLCGAPPPFPGPWLVTEDPRGTFGHLAANWFGNPGERITLIGITGTNGKTTGTYLLKEVLESALGAKVGLIGTNQNLIGQEVLPASRTTPDAYTLQGLLARMVGAGCGYGVMEVSSHALALKRTAGLRFRTGLFTNLTRDHLDFHGTMAAYRAAKGLLFRQCEAGACNIADPAGRWYVKAALCPMVTYGLEEPRAFLRGERLTLSPKGVTFLASTAGERAWVTVPIPGAFSAENALGVLACGLTLGIPLERAARALAHTRGVKGRLEVVPVPADFTVVIDYAHTPDALEKVLAALRPGCRGRLLCLFGCGGDRDKTKRPLMAAAAAAGADFVFLTSDNPRTEDPENILKEAAAGFPKGYASCCCISDRRRAIWAALETANPGDVLLLAGKGHETYQEIGGELRHLDEREEIASFFAGNEV